MGSITLVRRLLLSVVGVLMAVAIAERRLSDGDPHGPDDPVPPLWEQAAHTGSLPAANCVQVTSIERRSTFTLTSPEDGVRFDIDGDGDLDQVSWPASGSDVGFLCLDRNGDGRINNGRELIGDRTLPGAKSGPQALAVLAGNAAGGGQRATIDSSTPLLFKLLLWTDVNHDGISEPAELQGAHHVVSHIGLGYERHHRRDRHGNESRYRGFVHVRTAPGLNAVTSGEENFSRLRPLYDVCLVTRDAQR